MLTFPKFFYFFHYIILIIVLLNKTGKKISWLHRLLMNSVKHTPFKEGMTFEERFTKITLKIAFLFLNSSLHQDTVRIADQHPISTFAGHTGEITGLHITLTNKVVSSAVDFTVKVNITSFSAQSLFLC